MFGLAQDGKLSKAGIPRNPFRLALIVHDYEDQIYLARPPLAVQRALFGVLASIGRRLGYRAEYPYPYGGQAEEPLRPEGGRVSAPSGARTGAAAVGAVLVFLAAFLLLRWRRRSRS